MLRKLTHEQAAAVEGCRAMSPGEVMNLIACAGSGKTTTTVEMARVMQEFGPSAYLAFNRSVATEGVERLRDIECASTTMNSLAYRVCREEITTNNGSLYIPRPKDVIDRSWRAAGHVPNVRGWHKMRVGQAVIKAMGRLCQSADSLEDDIDSRHVRNAIIDMIGDPDIVASPEMKARINNTLDLLVKPLTDMMGDYFAQLATQGLITSDMSLKLLDTYPGYRENAFGGMSTIFVDEGQDLNEVQLSILKKAISEMGARLVFVGDPYQAIYGWRGARDAMSNFSGRQFHLTQSFRFGENVADMGRQILSFLPDGGPKELLTGVGSGQGRSPVKQAVICRTNLGLLAEAAKMIHRKIPFHIANIKDLQEDINSAIALHDGIMGNVKGKLSIYEDWSELKAESESGDAGLARLVEMVEAGSTEEIQNLVKKSGQTLNPEHTLLITAWGAKGAEYRKVRMGDDWNNIYAMKAKLEKMEGISEQAYIEAKQAFHALYVGVTRAEEQCWLPKDMFTPPDIEAEARAHAELMSSMETSESRSTARDQTDAQLMAEMEAGTADMTP